MKRSARPEPTSDSRASIYFWPKSKRPELQFIYDWLFDNGWRFNSTPGTEFYGEWFTPEEYVHQAHGILEHAPDCSWFRIQPSSKRVDGESVRADPILSVQVEAAD